MAYVNDLLSVVIPTYKRSEMLCRAIESILDQTYEKVECIVVNDNTPGDEYSQLLYSMLNKFKAEDRFHFVEQEVHKNGAAARNAGIRVAKGEYIAFLDDDDYWDREKAEVQIKILKKLPADWGGVSCLMKLHSHGRVVMANLPYKDGYIYYDVLTRRISMGTGSLIIRREALDVTGYFDENLRRFQDPQLFSCLTEKYKVRLVKRYLHNRDIDDAQNRPTVATITVLQEDFYKSISAQLERLPKKKVKVLKTIYDFDMAPLYWRGGEKCKAIKRVIGVFRYPFTLKLAWERVYGRYLSHHNIDNRIKRYS